MRPAGSPDVFIVLNGPQDGNEFPVGAPKIQIGQDNSCMVNLQLDQNVRPIHAIAMATGKGYSIRASTDSHVTVDGKRAGRFKSSFDESRSYRSFSKPLFWQVVGYELCPNLTPGND